MTYGTGIGVKYYILMKLKWAMTYGTKIGLKISKLMDLK